MDTRTVLETYTLRNIRDEIAHRFATWRQRRAVRPAAPVARRAYDDAHARRVGQFYDTHHDSFLAVYGDVIQAFRTRNVADLLDYQIRSIGLTPGQRVLDAGCGVGAPAIYFAKNAGVSVDAITISERQCEAARLTVEAEQLQDCVRIVHGDYHRLNDYFSAGSYDVICFLESLGHSRDKMRVVGVCWEMLKPGGVLYVKDLFARVPLQSAHAEPIAREIRRINEAYRYEIGSLNTLMDDVRRQGFVLAWVKTVDLELSAFEDLAISNEFQELTGIARIENWAEYVFPVDFFEVKCVKPAFDLAARLDRHYLQNLYHMERPARGPASTAAPARRRE
jgi:cyclopropane fatty-acyl-phospholipid synthase-like methyltransferase